MVSFIISYYETDAFRRRNLEFIVNSLKKLSIMGSEVIVVEQGSTQHYKTDDPFVVNVFIQFNSMFNKGLGYNRGVSVARNDILFFTDADIVMATQGYFNAIDKLMSFDVVDPYRDINYCNEEVSSDIIKGIKNTNYINTVRSGVISGGAFVIRKSVFLVVQGFDENCVGYGYEDTILDTKLTKLGYRICHIIDSCVHLYHPSPARNITNKEQLKEFVNLIQSSGYEYYGNFLKNEKLWKEYDGFTKEELISYLNEKHT
jgi:Glycosyltransferases, probably involved in cell wall biogenesis